ncbi:hypothetical protein BKA70DRAFT_1280352 [Coprinopsis sp. MPI-PUGE-AT-0042]|nr:hypothetical protein BKA70DRAFT_1280352 [Coprinopsis sp. MPI-PUGE-AT-0042]
MESFSETVDAVEPFMASLSRLHTHLSDTQPSKTKHENFRALQSQHMGIASINDSRWGEPYPKNRRGRPLDSKNTKPTASSRTSGHPGKTHHLRFSHLRLEEDGWDHVGTADGNWLPDGDQETPTKRARGLRETLELRLAQPNSTPDKWPGVTTDRWNNALSYGQQPSLKLPRASLVAAIQDEGEYGWTPLSSVGLESTSSESSSSAVSPFQRSLAPSLESRARAIAPPKASGFIPWFARSETSRTGDLFTYDCLEWPLPEYIVPDEELDDGTDQVAYPRMIQKGGANDSRFQNTTLGGKYNDSESVRMECDCIAVCSDEAATERTDGMDRQNHILEKQMLYERTLYEDGQKDIEHEIETLVKINEALNRRLSRKIR